MLNVKFHEAEIQIKFLIIPHINTPVILSVDIMTTIGMSIDFENNRLIVQLKGNVKYTYFKGNVEGITSHQIVSEI